VLLGIDKGTEQSVGRQTDSSWRVEHARVIEKVAAAGARTLAFDITLDAPGTEQQNVSIEQALQNTHETMPVVFGVAERNDDSPLPKFASHAHWGIACAGLKLGRAYLIPVAARRDVVPPPVESAPRAERYIVRPSLALAAFSGGGKVEPFDEWARTAQVTVMKPELLSQQVAFFVAETVASTQSGCTAIAKGDRVAYQLLDPLSLPTLREPPQRLPYESVLASEADTLAKLKGKIVLVGEQLPGKDTYTLSNGVERWGVELIAQHIDALAREKAIRSIGGLVQSLITLALGLLGAYVAFRLRRWTAARRAAVLFGLGALFVVAVVWWYRVEQQLIGLPYGIGALALGAWVASRLGKRKSI
jgi:CHASE2 domain-containing sensor protein